jgi:hypothetical protein
VRDVRKVQALGLLAVVLAVAAVVVGCGQERTARASEQRIDTAVRESTSRWSDVVGDLDEAHRAGGGADADVDLRDLSECQAAGVAAIFASAYEIRRPFLRDTPIWPEWEQQLAVLVDSAPGELRDEIGTIQMAVRDAMAPFEGMTAADMADPEVLRHLDGLVDRLEGSEAKAASVVIERFLLSCPEP